MAVKPCRTSPTLSTPNRPVIAELSARQVECLQRIAVGESSHQIAASLGLSPRTVDHYVGAACAKLGARSRAQAVVTAIRLRLIGDLEA
jgi:DNA-binding CsgD family transcriptional regulator